MTRARSRTDGTVGRACDVVLDSYDNCRATCRLVIFGGPVSRAGLIRGALFGILAFTKAFVHVIAGSQVRRRAVTERDSNARRGQVTDARRAWLIVVVLGAVLASVAAGVIAWNFFGASNPDYACYSMTYDWASLNIDVNSLADQHGRWSWWPTGLSCSYPLIGGGVIWVGPDPTLTIVLLAGISSVAAIVVGMTARAVLRRRAAN